MLQAEKNLILEEKITVLQQQNEELRARIEQNTVITRFVRYLLSVSAWKETADLTALGWHLLQKEKNSVYFS